MSTETSKPTLKDAVLLSPHGKLMLHAALVPGLLTFVALCLPASWWFVTAVLWALVVMSTIGNVIDAISKLLIATALGKSRSV